MNEQATSEGIKSLASTRTTKANPFENAVAVTVATHKWGIRRKVDTSSLDVQTRGDEGEEGEEVSPQALSVSKGLISCSSYKAIGQRDSSGRSQLKAIGLESMLRQGSYLIPLVLVDKAEEILTTWARERAALLDTFMCDYGGAVAQAREDLGPLFNMADYPTPDAVRAAFGLEWHYETFDVPGRLEQLRPELFAQERGKLAERMRVAALEIQDSLRVGLATLVQDLTTKLQAERENGKPAIFRDSSVTKVQEFLASFDLRNITGDDELASLVTKARAILDGRQADELRKDPNLRQFVGKQLASLAEQIDVVVPAKRKVSLDKFTDTDKADKDQAA